MRIFGGVNIKRFMEDDLPIEHVWITKAIANAQRKVEAHNYDIRKHLLEYDDVMNQQRRVVYDWRKNVLSEPNLRPMVFSMVEEIVNAIAEDFFPGGKIRKLDGESSLNIKELNEAVAVTFQHMANITENQIVPLNGEGCRKLLMQIAVDAYNNKEQQYTPDLIRQVEKMVLLSTIDALWKDHLLAMDHLRDGIGLQGYGQKDPLVEYKKQGFKFFEMMMAQITGDVVRKLFAVQISEGQSPIEGEEIQEAPVQNVVDSLSPSGSRPAELSGNRLPTAQEALGRPSSSQRNAPLLSPMPLGVDTSKLGRNDVCPCGSGKKFKKCHGAA
jgi:preprotein translocase subunit SecA